MLRARGEGACSMSLGFLHCFACVLEISFVCLARFVCFLARKRLGCPPCSSCSCWCDFVCVALCCSLRLLLPVGGKKKPFHHLFRVHRQAGGHSSAASLSYSISRCTITACSNLNLAGVSCKLKFIRTRPHIRQENELIIGGGGPGRGAGEGGGYSLV